jgi:sulfotransferase
MSKTYNFISGLPRSGTTLLSTILNQNPRFSAGISDPLEMYVNSVIKDTSTAVGMEAAVSIPKRREIIKGLFDSFYSDSNEVCFNTNRGWSANTALLGNLFPNFKMIVCLRDIPWILDSFEQLNAKNPYTVKPLYHHQLLATVYERCGMLMGNMPNFGGYVAGPLANVKQSMFSNERQHICYVEYDTLVTDPTSTMKQLYAFLNEPYFEHDFNNVEASYDEFDEQTKIIGLHKVRQKVEFRQRNSILPSDLYQQYAQSSFWKYNFDQSKKLLNWIQPNKTINTAKPAPNISRQL